MAHVEVGRQDLGRDAKNRTAGDFSEAAALSVLYVFVSHPTRRPEPRLYNWNHEAFRGCLHADTDAV